MEDHNIGFDADQVSSWLQVLVEPHSTCELRALYASGPPHVRHYASDDLLTMASDALRFGETAKGVYWLMNPLPSDWRGSPATDADIVRRVWLLVDFDPKRKGTSSATDDEKEAARQKMVEVDHFLSDRGWSPPIIADSGNGWHLLFRIDLPKDDEGLVVKVLHTLACRFDDESVSVDTKVGNASRFCKLYGTVSRKGDDTEGRPHRNSRIAMIPGRLESLTIDQMQSLIDESGASGPFDSQPTAPFPHPVAINRESFPDAIQRAQQYLATMDPSIAGEHGHDRLLKAASILVNDFCLTDGEAFDLLLSDFNPRCEPPWTEHDIRRKIDEAKKNPPNRPAKGPRADRANGTDPGEVTETTNLLSQPWPTTIDQAALYGVVGDIVRKIEPHTEADPIAILIQLLVALGNVIGRRCYFSVEATRHYANLFAVVVGSSSAGRKGTSGDHVTRVVRPLDEEWSQDRIFGGLVSGEGLIWQVHDPIVRQEPIREGGKKDGKVIGYQDVVDDPGVSDKRMLAFETEFSALLKAKSREKNSLSEVLRQAWDSGRLRTAAKTAPAKSTDAHISLIGHITPGELREVATAVDMTNGLANRFLWCCVRRTKLLPDGGEIGKVSFELELAKLRGAVEFAADERQIVRDASASVEWHRLYPQLTAERPGPIGAVCNRAPAQVVRLSLLYAILDQSPEVTIDHLRAAIAVWDYCEASVKHIFGQSLGNRIADEIFRALNERGSAGMSRTSISELFHRNKAKAELDIALQLLHSERLARRVPVPTGGRGIEMWYSTV